MRSRQEPPAATARRKSGPPSARCVDPPSAHRGARVVEQGRAFALALSSAEQAGRRGVSCAAAHHAARSRLAAMPRASCSSTRSSRLRATMVRAPDPGARQVAIVDSATAVWRSSRAGDVLAWTNKAAQRARGGSSQQRGNEASAIASSVASSAERSGALLQDGTARSCDLESGRVAQADQCPSDAALVGGDYTGQRSWRGAARA